MDNLIQIPMSERILLELQKLVEKESVSHSFKQMGTSIELYQLGNEEARIYKKMIGCHAGELDGHLEGFYEYWEFQRYLWWKKILQNLKLTTILTPLPFPLFRSAMDAGIKQGQRYFCPQQVIAHFHLLPADVSLDAIDYVKEEYWINNQIITFLNQCLKPYYKIEHYLFELRLIPLTQEAIEEDFEGEIYQSTLKKIQLSTHELEKIFSRRAKNNSY